MGLAVVVGSIGAGVGATAGPSARADRLEPFAHCGELVDYARARMLPAVTPWGFGGPPGQPLAVPAGVARPAATAVHSKTNVQEAGVDEPDVVKADGSRLFVLRGTVVHAIDARGEVPRLLGSLRIEDAWPQKLLLHGNRLIVIALAMRSVPPVTDPAPASPSGSSVVVAAATTMPFYSDVRLIEVDVRDASRMRVARTLTLDASYLDARVADGVARIVLTARLAPRGVEFVRPTEETPEAQERALEHNRGILIALPASSWLPSYELAGGGSKATRAPLVQCRHVRRPPGATDLGLTAILTIDLSKGLEPVDADAAMVSAPTFVYASPTSLYLADGPVTEGPMTAPPRDAVARIHRFDTSRAATHYRASASVPGALKNQWSLSEHAGALRVVTTRTMDDYIETFVTVLRMRERALRPVARIGNLGLNEDVYAIRFIGDVGYVVTFREIDPLYTLDVSNPEAPKLLGELKIPGYSAYLHPVADDLLLGVGQDVRFGARFGTQLSLFDVGDLRRPQRLQARRIGFGSSEAETNHHAFLYWPARRLAVVPFDDRTLENGSAGFVGAIGFGVDRERGIVELGRVVHGSNGKRAVVLRSVVVGDTLYTVSDWGVKANDVGTFAPRGAVGLRVTSPPAEMRAGVRASR